MRSKRAIAAIALFVAFALISGALLVFVENKVGKELELLRTVANASASSEETQKLLRSLSEIARGDERLVRHLLNQPLVAMGYMFMVLSLLPLLIALLSHDMINADIRSKTIRFILLRCSRAAFLFGKMLSHGLLLIGVMLLSGIGVYFYAWVRLPSFDAASVASTMFMYFVYSIIFGFCYISLTALVSSLIESGAVSLIVNLLVLAGFSYLSSIEGLRYLSPSLYKTGLWSYDIVHVVTSLLAFVAFGLFFCGLAWARMKWRDV